MLTAKQNMRETIKGGNPDRFVNQYEALYFGFHPYSMFISPRAQKGEMNVVDAWGITNSFPEDVPGLFPVHTPEKIVIKDIENWRDYVHAPSIECTEEQWAAAKSLFDDLDEERAFKTVFVAPGLFEMTHHLSEITNALTYYITNPDEMHELIDYLTEWELKLAESICTNLHPEVIFHHDDWGSETSTFLRPEMFAEFFVEPYKKIYQYYHDHGVELIVHHCDCYAATLVPYMIEMGIDVWQGPMQTNNVPELIKQYGDQITFMGDIDNKEVDFEGWTQEDCVKTVRRACAGNDPKYFIPCIVQGGPGSVYEGTYLGISKAIDDYNEEVFGADPEEQENARMPHQVMF